LPGNKGDYTVGKNEQDDKRNDVFERLKKILTSLLKIMQEKKPENRPKMKWNTDLINDLGVDSLESIDLMNAIEDEFDISPNLNEANTKTKICDVVDYILELEKQKSMRS
jgi:acyl carrier protein